MRPLASSSVPEQDPVQAGTPSAGVTCTGLELTLHHPLDTLPEPPRAALVAWLVEHGVDTETLTPGAHLVRDPVRRRLSWTSTPHGPGPPRTHLQYGARAVGVWPAAYPEVLRDATRRVPRVGVEPTLKRF